MRTPTPEKDGLLKFSQPTPRRAVVRASAAADIAASGSLRPNPHQCSAVSVLAAASVAPLFCQFIGQLLATAQSAHPIQYLSVRRVERFQLVVAPILVHADGDERDAVPQRRFKLRDALEGVASAVIVFWHGHGSISTR